MNENIKVRAVLIAATVGLNSYSAVDQKQVQEQPDLARPEPPYVTGQSTPSAHLSEISTSAFTPQQFANEIASIFAELSKDQEPLGADFKAVWDANIAELYES